MTGHEALAAFNEANALVKAGRYEEARAISLLTSDRKVIETPPSTFFSGLRVR